MRRFVLLAAVASVALLAGCTAAPADEQTSVRVYAAASLQAAFDDLAEGFELAHPEIDVEPIVYDGSSTLATQIVEGAPADVFASANAETMADVEAAGVTAEQPQIFATNTLVIAVPAGNPGDVTGLADLADPATAVVQCAVEVPCGAATATLLESAGVTVTPVSEEQNVTAVLTKVAAGEADAGFVYRTDAAAEDAVEAIVPPEAADVVNRYPIAPLSGASDASAAALFVAYVLSEAGRDVLDEHGFGAP